VACTLADYAVEWPGGSKINRLWTMPCIFWHREIAVAKNKSKCRGRSGRSAYGGNGGCGANWLSRMAAHRGGSTPAVAQRRLGRNLALPVTRRRLGRNFALPVTRRRLGRNLALPNIARRLDGHDNSIIRQVRNLSYGGVPRSGFASQEV